MSIKIALAGNPNSGKTTMFNALTGSSQYVGNWPGVTVEKKEGKLKGNKEVIIQDLPGIYSLSPYTLEEVVARNYLIEEQPDVVINIVDAANLERNLYLTSQLAELGLPLVIALNRIDVVQKQGDQISTQALAKAFGCTVVETSAVKGQGIKEVAEQALALAKSKQTAMSPQFSTTVERALQTISEAAGAKLPAEQPRWHAIKLLERDEKVTAKLNLDPGMTAQIGLIIAGLEKELDDDSESIITNERYEMIARVLKQSYHRKRQGGLSTSDKIDRIVTNRILALPIFAVVIFLLYYISISTVGGFATDWVNEVLFGEVIPPALTGFLEGIHTAPWLVDLIVEGIIGGVGAVLGFLPQMMVLFILLAILEDCGYMARIAFIMDRIFRKFGLSFIPMLVATGCGVPGIMASRTIENENDRRMTVITTTFIPCGAKLPIIALIAGALFGGAAWVAASAYFIGVAAIIVTGIILKKTRRFAGDPAPFVMELPAYHLPRVKGVLLSMWERSKAFVKKAGTIILLACIGVWFLSSFNWSFQMVETDESILAGIGRGIAILFAPLGWGDWRAAVAAITGLIAKENVVGTFGVLFGFAEVAEDGAEIWTTMAASFSALGAYSFLVFNLLCAPCFAAIGAIRREMMSAKWTWAAIAYQTGFAYIASLCIYQLGMLFTGHGFGIGTAVAILFVILFLYLLFRPASRPNRPTLRAADLADVPR